MAMKADLKARVYAHNLHRNYQCNLNLRTVGKWFFVLNLPRLGLPAKPQINLHNLKGDDDYAELSSRFKGSSVKILVWWLATETQKMADARGGDPLIIHLALSISYCHSIVL